MTNDVRIVFWVQANVAYAARLDFTNKSIEIRNTSADKMVLRRKGLRTWELLNWLKYFNELGGDKKCLI